MTDATTQTQVGLDSPTRTCDPVASSGQTVSVLGTSFVEPLILDGYELKGMIGAGGMGEVFRARCITLERDVAVKVLHPKYAAASAAAELFLFEARVTARLQHPGIPPVHAVGALEVVSIPRSWR